MGIILRRKTADRRQSYPDSLLACLCQLIIVVKSVCVRECLVCVESIRKCEPQIRVYIFFHLFPPFFANISFEPLEPNLSDEISSSQVVLCSFTFCRLYRQIRHQFIFCRGDFLPYLSQLKHISPSPISLYTFCWYYIQRREEDGKNWLKFIPLSI